MLIRILTDILLVLAVVIFPWWLSVPLAALFLFVFDNFYEIFLIGALADSLYGKGAFFEFYYVIIFGVCFLVAFLLKKRIRLYA
ncbi:MAG: hypothetical protein WCT19_04165 [Candidatus Paceibacterota bacterium]|jgi:hypothetical protein